MHVGRPSWRLGVPFVIPEFLSMLAFTSPGSLRMMIALVTRITGCFGMTSLGESPAEDEVFGTGDRDSFGRGDSGGAPREELTNSASKRT